MSSAVTTTVFNLLLLRLAGNVAVAAYGVVANFALVATAIFNGVSQGAQPLVSQCYGKRDRAGVRKLLGLGSETGTIECGKAADILVTRENPLDDLSALSEPMHVMCRGELVRKLKAKHIPEVDAELDAIMAMPAEALAEERARDGVE